MRRVTYGIIGLTIFAIGYLAGTDGWFNLPRAHAQVAADLPPDVSEATATKIKEARYALQEAMEALQSEGKYEAITADPNAFLILAGGGNAREDLEAGRGVDPETFAALYAGYATPEIADHLGYDDKRRLTYQNKVVRMYSVSRLQQMYHERMKFAEPGF